MFVVFVTRILPSKWLHHKSSFIITTNLTYKIEHYKKTKTKKTNNLNLECSLGFSIFYLKRTKKRDNRLAKISLVEFGGFSHSPSRISGQNGFIVRRKFYHFIRNSFDLTSSKKRKKKRKSIFNFNLKSITQRDWDACVPRKCSLNLGAGGPFLIGRQVFNRVDTIVKESRWNEYQKIEKRTKAAIL